jgi:osmoprotectant transport system ATP-binding protein
MMNGLIRPSSGKIFVNGQDTATVDERQLRLSIGYAIQSVGLFPHMTVFENIAVVPRLLHWSKERISARVEELLDLVGLPPSEYMHNYPHQLSGGEAQRIGVARALAGNPPIMLMDEPFGAVDPLTREKLQAQFLEIQKEIKKTIVLVTHDLDEAIRLADRIAIMQSGKLVQYDTPEVILSKPGNRFVRDFVGADRALKRLSRTGVGDFTRPAAAVNADDTVENAIASAGDNRWLWVTDNDRKLMGWVDKDNLTRSASIREAMDMAEPEEISIMGNATLRDALSRMLGLGFRYIPVVDGEYRLIGEVGLGDIEDATTGEEG